MQGNPQVLKTLQDALPMEAHLNLQYRLNQVSAKMAGVKKTAKKMKEFGDDAHDWMSEVTKRIEFLEGNPGYSVQPIVESTGIKDMLESALALEVAIVKPYEMAIQLAMKALDDTTRNLFEHLTKWHQGHVGWLEIQLRLITKIGEEEYIAEKL